MRFFLKIIFIAALALLAQSFFPWWSVAIAAFVVSIFIRTKGFSSFIAGFIALFFLWSIKAYYIDMANEQLLSNKIATLFNTTPVLLIAITGVVGGLVAGFASLTGTTFAALFIKKKKTRNKYY